jgi:hypothetical protein
MSPGQLYSTASYAQRDLRGIRLSNLSLNGWNLRGQDLRGAHLVNTDLENTDFSLADLRGVAGFMPHESTIQRNMIDPDSILIDLNLQAGETLVAHAGGHHGFPVAMFGEFKIDPSAKVDITDNPAVVFEAPASAVRAQLIAGRGATGLGGTWTGNGIASSTAAAANAVEPDSRSIGYAENASLPLGPYNEFHGFPVLPESVLLAYTRTGDANLDGVVNDDDVTIVGATYAPGVSNPHWALGDFDYNGFVDDDDRTLVGAFYDPSAPPLAAPSSGVAAVPEPDVVALLASSLLGIVLAVLVRRKSLQANS